MRKAYTEAIESYLREGYAQEITEEDIQNASTVWYLSHHPVVNPSKPGKLRVVFDCAAKFNGTFSNDKLMKGPDLANSLVGVLTRFRKNKVTLVADVKAMFHQIKVFMVTKMRSDFYGGTKETYIKKQWFIKW